MRHDNDHPKIQVLTVEGLLAGAERIDAPLKQKWGQIYTFDI